MVAQTAFGRLAPRIMARFKARGDVREVTIERFTKVLVDAGQPSLGFTTDTITDKFDAAIVPINRDTANFTSVERTDRQAIIAADDVAAALRPIQSNDVVIDGTLRLTVVEVDTIGPGVEDVVYKAQVRA